MLAKTFFAPCKSYSWDNFKTDFRLITDENLPVIAQLYGYSTWEKMYDEIQVHITGLIAYIRYEKIYEPDPIDLNMISILAASETLQQTPQNIGNDIAYNSANILWMLGFPSHVIPHSILEFMEHDGEGDIALNEADTTLVRKCFPDIE